MFLACSCAGDGGERAGGTCAHLHLALWTLAGQRQHQMVTQADIAVDGPSGRGELANEAMCADGRGSPMDPMVMKRPQLYGMGSSPHSQPQQSSPYPGGSYGPPGPQRYPLGIQGRTPGAMAGMQYPQQQYVGSMTAAMLAWAEAEEARAFGGPITRGGSWHSPGGDRPSHPGQAIAKLHVPGSVRSTHLPISWHERLSRRAAPEGALGSAHPGVPAGGPPQLSLLSRPLGSRAASGCLQQPVPGPVRAETAASKSLESLRRESVGGPLCQGDDSPAYRCLCAVPAGPPGPCPCPEIAPSFLSSHTGACLCRSLSHCRRDTSERSPLWATSRWSGGSARTVPCALVGACRPHRLPALPAALLVRSAPEVTPCTFGRCPAASLSAACFTPDEQLWSLHTHRRAGVAQGSQIPPVCFMRWCTMWTLLWALGRVPLPSLSVVTGAHQSPRPVGCSVDGMLAAFVTHLVGHLRDLEFPFQILLPSPSPPTSQSPTPRLLSCPVPSCKPASGPHAALRCAVVQSAASSLACRLSAEPPHSSKRSSFEERVLSTLLREVSSIRHFAR
ncbi:AT-rich interactive domain-containing protein 1B [Galemys pyrenaicus]|uniref:AT-rich interactive domain-containing protein 1B n=1 Tax=Galemys pyrenaicus TaxID=202257 RepID=A0A8J6AK23_GALPY|nr:AT-rich interactive domain-containing protein 1B [Galemys pyrenaicus]